MKFSWWMPNNTFQFIFIMFITFQVINCNYTVVKYNSFNESLAINSIGK